MPREPKFPVVEFIAAKRDGQEHSPEALDSFVREFMSGTIADYQMSAWLMAAFLKGLSPSETASLTQAMVHSGKTFPLGHFGPHSVDKHSTGGVGDKTSLVVVPLCASLGAIVPKMSGRSLGFTGGTLDKLESIPGFRTYLSLSEFERVVSNVGAVISAQTEELTPADRRMYALRDVTATVESKPLIAASIMSKKLALGCSAVILDIKAGSGAFMPDVESARALAEMMSDIGKRANRKVVALIATMEQPLGMAVGNSLEVLEALDTLQGKGPKDFTEHCLAVASEMLCAAKIEKDATSARNDCVQALQSGQAETKLLQMVAAQGGSADKLEQRQLPAAPVKREVTAPREGWIEALDARRVGYTVARMGAGRFRKEDKVDHRVGIVFARKRGNFVKTGEILALLHARTDAEAEAAGAAVLESIVLGSTPPEPIRHIQQILRS